MSASDARLLWFVQTNLQPEPQEELFTAIERHAQLGTFIGIPFQIEPPPLPAGFCFPLGTCNVIERIRSVRPELIQGDLFDYRDYLRHFGDLCLNRDAWTGTLREFRPTPSDFPLFLRPAQDDKSFAGELWETGERFESWKEAIVSGVTVIDPECTVVAASPKEITEEWRLIVVRGEIATYSRYRLEGRSQRDRPTLRPELLAVAQEAIARWSPADIFALDLAVTEAGVHVLELGSIHSCGLYACDREAFVRSITEALSGRR